MINISPEPAVVVAIVCSGVFFLTGLLTGVWKWRETLASPEHRAHVYVDIAHRASLMYSFSALLLAVFAGLSAWGETMDLVATSAPLAFFAIAIGTYIWHAIRRQTDNQFAEKNFITTFGTWLLAVAEIGGFVVIFTGALVTLFG